MTTTNQPKRVIDDVGTTTYVSNNDFAKLMYYLSN